MQTAEVLQPRKISSTAPDAFEQLKKAQPLEPVGELRREHVAIIGALANLQPRGLNVVYISELKEGERRTIYVGAIDATPPLKPGNFLLIWKR